MESNIYDNLINFDLIRNMLSRIKVKDKRASLSPSDLLKEYKERFSYSSDQEAELVDHLNFVRIMLQTEDTFTAFEQLQQRLFDNNKSSSQKGKIPSKEHIIINDKPEAKVFSTGQMIQPLKKEPKPEVQSETLKLLNNKMKRNERQEEEIKKSLQNKNIKNFQIESNFMQIDINKNIKDSMSKKDFKVVFKIRLPKGCARFNKILNFYGNQESAGNMILLQTLNKRLAKYQYAQGENIKQMDFQDTIYIKDKLGNWSFDVFFGLFKIYLEKINTGNQEFFPSKWCIDPNEPSDYIIEFEEFESALTSFDENMNIDSFMMQIGQKYNKKELFQAAIDIFRKKGIETVKELVKVFDSYPQMFDTNYGIKPIMIAELKAFEAQISNPSTAKEVTKEEYLKENLYERTKEVLIFKANFHRVKRYFYFNAGEDAKGVAYLNYIPYLDEDCLNLAVEVCSENFKNETLLQNIKEFYQPLTIPLTTVNDKSIPRGVLFYGPPGTGKTTVSDLFPEIMGLTPINKPISSTELNRGLVGETEAILIDLCERGHRVKHLLTCLAVDEIDSLVPRRDDKENANKGDKVATLLSLIGGIKDVPNLVFIASTNFIKKIDEAFSRRMSGKFFVGRMDQEARMALLLKVNKGIDMAEMLKNAENKQLEKIKEQYSEYQRRKAEGYSKKFQLSQTPGADNMDQDVNMMPSYDNGINSKNSNKNKFSAFEKTLLDNLKFDKNGNPKSGSMLEIVCKKHLEVINRALINFTPAAVNRLVSDTTAFVINHYRIPTAEEVLKIARKTARKMNIKLGNYFLPDFFSISAQIGVGSIKVPNTSLGFVLVDLKSRKYKFKVDKIRSRKKVICFEDIDFPSSEPAVSLTNILSDLARFAFENNLHSMQLIDLQSLINNAAYDDSKAQENINEIIYEMNEYPKSMLIIDLDSVVGSSISESDGMGKSTSKSITNQKLFFYVRDIANNYPKIDYKPNSNYSQIETCFWVFVVSFDSFLIESMTKALGIEKSDEELKKHKEEEEKSKQKLRCVRCQKYYYEKDNKSLDGCQYHLGFVYDSSQEPYMWDLLDLYNEEDGVKQKVESHIVCKKKKSVKKPKKKKQKKVNFNRGNDEDGFMNEFNVDDIDVSSEEEIEDDKQKDSEKNPYVYICCKKHYGEGGSCENSMHTDNKQDFDNYRYKKKEKMEEELQYLKDRAEELKRESDYFNNY
jgi:hypothetical protein